MLHAKLIDNPTLGIDTSTSGIDNPTSGIDNPTLGIDNPTSGIVNPTLGIVSAIVMTGVIPTSAGVSPTSVGDTSDDKYLGSLSLTQLIIVILCLTAGITVVTVTSLCVIGLCVHIHKKRSQRIKGQDTLGI